MIEHCDVDGIPTVVTPTAGPLRAGLIFRVGRADEHLAVHGITRLAARLACHGPGGTGHAATGTGMITTQLEVSGPAETIVEQLNGFCAALAELPVGRLADEQERLQVEAEERAFGVADQMPMWRHGARGFGLASYPEWGLETVTPEAVAAWARTWFTRQNAVLWIAGACVPAGLRLRLADGVRQAAPRPSSALPVTPAYFHGDPGAVVHDSVHPRGPAAEAFARVLHWRLASQLPQATGHALAMGVDWHHRDQDTGTVTARIEAAPDACRLAWPAMLATIRDLAERPPDRGAIDAMVAEAVARIDGAVEAALPGYAADVLTGATALTPTQRRAAWRDLRPEDVCLAATRAMRSALLMAPPDAVPEVAGFEAAPCRSRRAVIGTACPTRGDRSTHLVVGPDGVSTVDPDGPVTVRFDGCVAMLAWPDGARELIGADAMTVTIEPTLTMIDAEVLAGIDAAVPAMAVVPMADRDPASIPRPVRAPVLPAAWRAVRRLLPIRRIDGSPAGPWTPERIGRVAVSIAVTVGACVAAAAVLRNGADGVSIPAVIVLGMLVRRVWVCNAR